MAEIWKPVPGFAAYDVSDQGRVRSYWQRQGIGMPMLIAKTPQRMLRLTQSSNPGGYLKLTLYASGKPSTYLVAHLVLNAFVGPMPPGMEACHGNNISNDNRLENLRWDSSTGNKTDATQATREIWANNGREYHRKLTDATIVTIRERYATDPRLTLPALASEYGVSCSAIGRLCAGDTYTYLDGPRTKGRFHGGKHIS